MLGILGGKEGMVKRIIPKASCHLVDVVEFYLKSQDFLRLKGRSQKEYEAHLHAALSTVVEAVHNTRPPPEKMGLLPDVGNITQPKLRPS